jgi:cysteinyl-tRNA synthetase
LNFPRAVKTIRFTPEPMREAAGGPPVKVASAVPGVEGARPPIAAPMGKAAEVKNWRYQLQNVNPGAIAHSSSDLVVVDSIGTNGAFSREQVEEMRRKPDGSRRIVLSYMSIGEAESYRWYWPQRSSAWLGRENPKWKGNYGVRFWLADWQKIIFEYTDRIVAAGFDGVYLDKVDEYEEMGHRDDMVEFVARIGQRAKAQRADFLIVSQNGDQLTGNPKFRNAIDAFAREDLLYGESADGVRNSAASIRDSVERLKLLTAEGKPVFVVEYPRTEQQAHTATREISEHGFVGLMARRALDVLER